MEIRQLQFQSWAGPRISGLSLLWMGSYVAFLLGVYADLIYDEFIWVLIIGLVNALCISDI